jgi:hypothetical protein
MVLGLGIVAFAVACGGPTTAAKSSAAAGSVGGYLWSASGVTEFLQWTQTGDNFTGTGQLDEVTRSAPNLSVSSRQLLIKGAIKRSRITITFDRQSPDFGNISGGMLNIQAPGSDGTLETFTFHPASVALFNTSVTKMRADAAKTNRAVAAREQRQTQESDGQAAVRTDSQAVTEDVGNVNADVATVKSDLHSMEVDVAGEAHDYGSEQQDEQTVVNDMKTASGQCDAQERAGSIGVDAGHVGSDLGTVQGDAGSLNGHEGDLKSDLGQLRRDFASLQTASQTVPAYIPANGIPTGATVDNAVAAAKTELTLTDTAETTATATANEIHKEADALSKEATQIAMPAKCN